MSPIGVTVATTEVLAPSGPPTTTGVAFFAGLTDQGPLTAVGCANLNQYIATFGPRTPSSAVLYDAVDEFFNDGGSFCYIARASDNTAVAAALTLSDAGPHPSVVVSAATPGIDGNNTYAAVARGSNATFTGSTTSTSVTVTAVSSFANIGVGTPVSGAGIPAGTYVATVNPGASSLTLSIAATATAAGVAITPATFTVTVQDNLGDVLETHGPYITTAQLFADTASIYVTFTQSAAGGFTVNVPVTSAAAALTGGVDLTDISAAIYVTALAAFSGRLGPGQVAVPGQNNSTVWVGLAAHAQQKNRVAILDVGDNSSASAVIAALGSIGANASYCIPVEGSVTQPGLVPGTVRTIAGSAAVAGLCARAAATGNDATAPAGTRYPLGVSGITEQFSGADINTLNAAGINVFNNRYGRLCLFGFVSAVLPAQDPVFWQASAARERMALVADCLAVGENFLFDSIDGQGKLLANFGGQLQGVIADHWKAGALWGATAADAGYVDMSGNTPTTEQAGELVATLNVQISPFAQQVPIVIAFHQLGV